MLHLLALLFAADITVTPKGGAHAIEQVRDQLRASGQPATITLRPGDYFIDHSLAFDARDPAGSTYRAQGKVRLIGGVKINQWSRVTNRETLDRLTPEARKHVVMAKVANLGELKPRGFGREHSPAHSELFFNGARMTLARYPNTGFVRIADPADPTPQDDEHGGRLGRLPYGFRYAEDRPSQWKADKNIWVHGYWAWEWADSYEHIATLDAATKTITTTAPHGLYGFRKNQRYYFLNVLEELDSPGEFYLDAPNTTVYFWPPSDPRRAEVFLSTLDKPVLTFTGANGITIDGVSIEATRANAVNIEGGAHVTLQNITLRNTGNSGVIIKGGSQHSVARCSISYTGDSAIEIEGGNRRTLTPAGHRVEDCDIHHMGEWVRTYNPAVKVNGVGNIVAHNEIHDAPHAGIILTGNDHLIESNNIHHLAMETGDVGAIYIGRDYTERGNIVRHNYIHELGGVGLGSMAVYLDDCSSGTTVDSNFFYKLKFGAFIGGGRDNIVTNNTFISCNPAVRVDGRGIEKRPVWQNMVYNIMKPRVEAMHITESPYAEKYPLIKNVLPYLSKPGGVPPEGNVIRGNRIYGPGVVILELAKPFVTDVGDNATLPEIPEFPLGQFGPRNK